MLPTANQLVPAHVPADLVREYPFAGMGQTTTKNPRSLIKAIHEGPRVIWAPGSHHLGSGAWVPRRHADLQAIYMDTDHFTSRGMAPFSMLTGESWYLIPAEADHPLHMKYRLALNPMLAPARISELDDRIRAHARNQLEALRARDCCDFVADFAFKFPIIVFLELMGLPLDRMEQFLRWEHDILRAKSIEQVAVATKAITTYLSQECADRRINPRNDLLTLGVQAQVEGRGLTDDELTGFCFNLFVGGLDTVSTNLSVHFRHLAEHPDDQALLRAQPEKIPDAIEELMRAYASVSTSRRCIAETKVGDVTILPGDFVLLPTMLAANDPEAFDDPEKVDFDRKPRHVSFGYGPHNCIGVHLARREMRIAMEEALTILPVFGIAPGATIESYLAGVVGPVELPLVWHTE